MLIESQALGRFLRIALNPRRPRLDDVRESAALKGYAACSLRGPRGARLPPLSALRSSSDWPEPPWLGRPPSKAPLVRASPSDRKFRLGLYTQRGGANPRPSRPSSRTPLRVPDSRNTQRPSLRIPPQNEVSGQHLHGGGRMPEGGDEWGGMRPKRSETFQSAFLAHKAFSTARLPSSTARWRAAAGTSIDVRPAIAR